jgi:hypothetical protein
MTREDYINHLASGCRISVGKAEAAVDDALASKCVRRQGYLSDVHRAGLMEDGEPDPGAGPHPMRRVPDRRVPWLERNTFKAIEYSVADLDFETRAHWQAVKKKREPGLSQEAVTELLRAKVTADPVLKDWRGWLRDQDGVKEPQIRPAIEALQGEGWRRTRGRQKTRS